MMLDPLFLILLGHFCGDFAFQSDNMAASKRSSKRVLAVHVLIYTVTIAAFLFIALRLNGSDKFFTWSSAAFLLFLYVEHWLQDYIKTKQPQCTRQAYYLDQALHVIILFAARIVIYNG